MSLATLGNAEHDPPKGRKAMRAAASWFALVFALGGVVVAATGQLPAAAFFLAVAALLGAWAVVTRSRKTPQEPLP